MFFDIDRYLVLDWQSYYSCVQLLAEKILTAPASYSRIIGISRCGLTLGHILSDLLELPVTIVGTKSYSGVEQQGKIRMTQQLGTSISGQNILLVDGIA